ncbi:MAG: hypothetical protein WD875_19310 [Pirellulales bacterium]
MNANVNAAALDAKQAACFERLKDTLLAKRFHDRLSRPLAYWALPNDRRLPQALLDFPLAEVLNKEFTDLAATRGIGRKKLESLFVLLARAAGDQAPGADLVELHNGRNNVPHDATTDSAALAADAMASFNPGVVSEALWQQWQSSVRMAGVTDLAVGRIVPSLERVPSVIWQAPLSRYIDRSLGEIRNMRTHGVKRIGVILHAYYLVNRAWQNGHSSQAVRQALVPRFIEPIERWAASCIERQETLAVDEVKSQLVEPLLAQVEIDCGELVARLSRERLGVDGKPLSVRGQSRRLNVTRARVYQIFEQCGKALEVRWPSGRDLLHSLVEAAHRHSAENPALRLLSATVELCFPRRTEDEMG